jgi:hypothetical protein
MSGKEFTFNIVLSVCDAIVCIVSILCLCYLAVNTGKWWITLFGFVPLAFYNNHNIFLIKRGDEEDS